MRIELGRDEFLSASNPTATVEQCQLERLALEVLEMPTIRQATEAATRRYKILAGRDIPAEALLGFDEKMREWAFHYVLMGLNSDPHHPIVQHHDYGPPHEWFGMSVPGCRGPGTGENIDNAYVKFPIDGRSRYVLHGQRQPNPTGDCPLHVVGNLSMSMNIASLGIRETQFGDDGSFAVTIDPEPANGRPNHLQTTIDSKYIFIRDARVNWRQVPSAWRLQRLDKERARPLSLDEKVALAARFIIDDVAMNFWFKQMIGGLDENTISLPSNSQFWGGQPSQILGRGHYRLEDDEAFVITLKPGGSQYHNLIVEDFWNMTLNYWDHTSTLNSDQSLTNDDGSYTYVVSLRDPGVHNWLDSVGLHETTMLIRFQLLPQAADGRYGGHPELSGQRVKLADLDAVLPLSTKRVTAEERRAQLAERRAAFDTRFTV